jgi:hypothetical protein
MRITTKVVEEYKVKVLNSYPSIFTKDDVIELLTNLSQSLETVPTESDLETRILDSIEDVVSGENIGDNVELELNGFEISCSYDIDDLVDSLRSMVKDEFNQG